MSHQERVELEKLFPEAGENRKLLQTEAVLIKNLLNACFADSNTHFSKPQAHNSVVH